MSFKKDIFHHHFKDQPIFKKGRGWLVLGGWGNEEDTKEQKSFEEESKESRENRVIEPLDELENILKDHWAFWLDSKKNDIEKVESQSQLKVLLKSFEDEFIAVQKSIVNNGSYKDLLQNFINTPEAATKLGRAHFSKWQFSHAQQCFKRGIA